MKFKLPSKHQPKIQSVELINEFVEELNKNSYIQELGGVFESENIFIRDCSDDTSSSSCCAFSLFDKRVVIVIITFCLEDLVSLLENELVEQHCDDSATEWHEGEEPDVNA